MRNFLKASVLPALGLGALLLSVTGASAAIACNAQGECWHVRRAYNYAPAYGVVVHPNGWRWGPGDHYRWHEHTGRGYWRGGVWVGF